MISGSGKNDEGLKHGSGSKFDDGDKADDDERKLSGTASPSWGSNAVSKGQIGRGPKPARQTRSEEDEEEGAASKNKRKKNFTKVERSKGLPLFTSKLHPCGLAR